MLRREKSINLNQNDFPYRFILKLFDFRTNEKLIKLLNVKFPCGVCIKLLENCNRIILEDKSLQIFQPNPDDLWLSLFFFSFSSFFFLLLLLLISLVDICMNLVVYLQERFCRDVITVWSLLKFIESFNDTENNRTEI